MRAQDKKFVENYWFIAASVEETAKRLNLPLDEVRAVFKKLDKREEYSSETNLY